jgi:Leucine-rich repeat (LRR) protein
MTTSILIEQELERLNTSFGSALHHNAFLFKRMIAAGLSPQVARHLERFKALLAQQRELGQVLLRDLSACESLSARMEEEEEEEPCSIHALAVPFSDLIPCSPSLLLSDHGQNLGLLGLLPENALHLVMQRLEGYRDARCVCWALRSLYDSKCSSKILIKNTEAAGSDHTQQLLDLMQCSPHMSQIQVSKGSGSSIDLVQVLKSDCVRQQLQTLDVSDYGLRSTGARQLRLPDLEVDQDGAFRLLEIKQELDDIQNGVDRLVDDKYDSAIYPDEENPFYPSFLYGQVLAVQALAPGLQGLQGLTKLNIQKNMLLCEGAELLAPALEKLSALEHLDLSYNHVGHAGMRALAPSLQHLQRLQTLDIGHNDINALGAAALAPALPHLTGLQTLDLTYNILESEGAAALAPALKHLTCLKNFSFRGNNIKSGGAAVLAPALQHLTGLQTVDLGDNGLKSEEAAALAPALQQLTGLLSLDLSWNDF